MKVTEFQGKMSVFEFGPPNMDVWLAMMMKEGGCDECE